MLTWLQGFLLKYILGAVLSSLQALEGKINWAALQADMNTFLMSVPLGSFIDAALAQFADDALGLVQTALNGQLQATVLADLVAGNYAGALSAVEAALIAIVTPGQTPSTAQLAAAIAKGHFAGKK